MSNPPDNDLSENPGAGGYVFTPGDKIVGALGALRIRFFPRRNLVAGPYVGEFGHELMDWQAWVRGQVGRYDEVHVITYPGRDYLYRGCRVHYHDIALEKAGYMYGRFTPAQWKEMAESKAEELGIKDYDLLTPLHICTRYHRRYLLPAKYELLGDPPPADRIRDVGFHFRWVKKAGRDQTKNYPSELCDRVVALCKEQNLSMFCVGHPRYSYCPPGVEDRRAEDLEASVAAISSARLLAGELSGALHLAQLCGVPILIWADRQGSLDTCEYWNVFRVPTYIVANDTRRPDPQLVCDKIVAAMKDLRERTGGFRDVPYTLPR